MIFTRRGIRIIRYDLVTERNKFKTSSNLQTVNRNDTRVMRQQNSPYDVGIT